MTAFKNSYALVLAHANVIERLLAITLIALLAVVASLYMYFVGSAAYAAAETKTLSREAVAVEGELAALEARYHEAREGITRGTASDLGLVAYEAPVFASIDTGIAVTLEVR